MPTEMVEPDRHPPGFYRRLADPGAPAGGRRRSFASWLRRRFVVGFLVALPLVVTLFFARFLFQLMDRWFRPISHQLFGREIPGIGLLLVLAIMLLLGVIATNVVGGRLLAYLERLIARVPLLSPIYKGARQVTEAIQIGDTAQFRKVVLVEFPGPGLTSVGFVTREIGVPTQLCPEPAFTRLRADHAEPDHRLPDHGAQALGEGPRHPGRGWGQDGDVGRAPGAAVSARAGGCEPAAAGGRWILKLSDPAVGRERGGPDARWAGRRDRLGSSPHDGHGSRSSRFAVGAGSWCGSRSDCTR